MQGQDTEVNIFFVPTVDLFLRSIILVGLDYSVNSVKLLSTNNSGVLSNDFTDYGSLTNPRYYFFLCTYEVL